MDLRPLPTKEFTAEITDKDIAFYRENGYLGVQRVTTDEEVEWLREVYDQLIGIKPTGLLDGLFDLARPYGTTDRPILGQLLQPERFLPQIKQTQAWKNAHRISSRLLGEPLTNVDSWGHLIFKGANSPAETPWHQDEAYWDVTKDYNALGTWMPLDDVDTNNGCLWFVPKSHTGDVLPHMHGNDDPAVHVLQFREKVDCTAGVPVPLKAGGMSFHHARTYHYAGDNKTPRVRRAWAHEFQTTPVQREVAKDYPWITAGRKALADAVEKSK
jgi:hypothetical protein